MTERSNDYDKQKHLWHLFIYILLYFFENAKQGHVLTQMFSLLREWAELKQTKYVRLFYYLKFIPCMGEWKPSTPIFFGPPPQRHTDMRIDVYNYLGVKTR